MTAEVGVLNSIGVALAADSAVSIGRDAEKIYTSADKIFHLAAGAPVGTMIFGNAELAGLPWETIIKVYRTQLEATRFDTLEEYASDVLRFLAQHQGMFPQAAQDRHTELLVGGLLVELREELRGQRRQMERTQGNTLGDPEVAALLDTIAQQFLGLVQQAAFLTGFSAGDLPAIEKRYGTLIATVIKGVFDGVPVDPTTHATLRRIAVESLARQVPGNLRSGVVIAGFGEAEYLPGLVHCQIEGLVLGRLRLVTNKPVRVEGDMGAAVVPFAQQEMVHSFMEGIDRQLLGFMERSTQDLFDGVVGDIIKLVGQADPALAKLLTKAVRPQATKAITSLLTAWKDKRQEYWGPVLSITASLPKDELAAMAEALVNLTKFRRRVTTARETVGGPIDVALITKGDGFVWVKRKHYFDPHLNPRVMARYQQGG